MSDTIYDTNWKNASGKYEVKEKEIKPTSQVEADAIYADLDKYMCDESIFSDGEASYSEAKAQFNFYLHKAKKVKERGFLPTIDSDVFYPKGYVPKSWKEYRGE